MLPIHLSIKYVSSLPSSLSCHHVMAAVIMVLLFSSHCRGVIIFVLHRCGVVSIIVLLCCLCCCCCRVMSWLWSSRCHRCSCCHFITVVVVVVSLCHCSVVVLLL